MPDRRASRNLAQPCMVRSMAETMTWLKQLFQKLDAPLFTLGDHPITTLKIIIFIITLVVAAILGRVVRKAIRRYFGRRGDVSEGAIYALERIAGMLVMAIGVLVGLENVGVDLTALTALGALLSVGIGFGLQGVAQNWVSGLTLLIERPVQRGDFVIVGDTVGVVEAITMRATRIMTRDKVAIIVPNSDFVTGKVVNMTQPDRMYRLRIPVGVAYGSDTAKVKECLLQVASENDDVLEDPAPQVFFVDFGNSSLDFELGVWLNQPAREPDIASALRFRIDAIFRESGVEIPFPQRDLHIRSGLPKELRPDDQKAA